MMFMSNNLELTMALNLEIAFLSNFVMKREFLKTFPIPAHLNKNGVAEWKNRILKEAARTMLSGSVFSKQYWTEAVTTACYTQNRYLKGTPNLGLWYPKCLGFDLKGYSDSDYVGCNIDMKSTSGACQLLGSKLVCWSAKKH
ncbi:retrovirus-related pol polyprotein from transposon TNT 1-94 [Tanacetum coccineum]